MQISRANGHVRRPLTSQPCVWAVGGGKGGVGKSVITSNLAIALARRGRRCIVVDVDLGGANLHTILGVRKPHRTLTHFLNREVSSLADLVCETPVTNLSLVSGSGALLGIANLKYSQKQKLVRHFYSLEADHVFLDLSAGSAYNVLDFYLAARQGILVMVPEPTSIENAYHFLKAAFYRSLSYATRHGRVRAVLQQVLAERETRPVPCPRDLIARVREIDPPAGKALEDRARSFAPMLVVNQVRTPEHRRLGEDIGLACRDYLGTEVEYIGCLERDEAVHTAVSKRQPVLDLIPGCSFSRDLERLAIRLLNEETFEELESLEDAERVYRERRELYQEGSLATHGLFSEEDRRVRLGRLEAAYAARRSAEQPLKPEEVPPPPPPLPAGDFAEPGAYLRRCREHLGLQLVELYERTRLGSLESIEDERFAELPPEPYLRAHVLQYARVLGIREAEELAASFVERSRRAAA